MTTTDPRPPSGDLAAEIAAHRPRENERGDGLGIWCLACRGDWPCLVRRLATEVGRLSAALAASVAARTPLTLDDSEYRVLWRLAEANLVQGAQEIEEAGREVGRLVVVVADRDCELRSVRGEWDALLAVGNAMAEALLAAGIVLHDQVDGTLTIEKPTASDALRQLRRALDAWRALAPAAGEDAR